MSVSKWRYTEECNGRPCPGDCDHCSFEPTDLISRADAIEAIEQEYKIDRGYMADDYTYGFNQAIQYVSDIILQNLPSAEAVPQLKQTDTLIIADALRYLALDTERHLADRTRADALRQQFLKYGASMCKGGDDE